MRRAIAVLLTASTLLAALFALLTLRLFVSPPADNPSHVDAVVVLSGDWGERMARARPLIDAGVATVLVHAGSPDSGQVIELCRNRQAFEVVCIEPQPDSTRAEARAVGSLARSRRWRSIAIVTTAWHTTRAGLLFRRCFDGHVYTFGAPRSMQTPGAWVRNVVREWSALLYALALERQC